MAEEIPFNTTTCPDPSLIPVTDQAAITAMANDLATALQTFQTALKAKICDVEEASIDGRNEAIAYIEVLDNQVKALQDADKINNLTAEEIQSLSAAVVALEGTDITLLLQNVATLTSLVNTKANASDLTILDTKVTELVNTVTVPDLSEYFTKTEMSDLLCSLAKKTTEVVTKVVDNVNGLLVALTGLKDGLASFQDIVCEHGKTKTSFTRVSEWTTPEQPEFP